jgi:repressor LexA
MSSGRYASNVRSVPSVGVSSTSTEPSADDELTTDGDRGSPAGVGGAHRTGPQPAEAGPALSAQRQRILEVIAAYQRQRGYPPSVREIAEAVGLSSTSSVHSHLRVLQRDGYLRRDPAKPRALEIHWEPREATQAPAPTAVPVPLVGDVAAGLGVLAEQAVEEYLPVPATLVTRGELFALRVRGDSMIDAGILDGDVVVVRAQDDAEPGQVVVAGLPDGDATVKRYERRGGAVVLVPANARLTPLVFRPDEVRIFGRVVSLLRRL